MAPVISALNPTQGPAAGGNQVTISGSSFIGATAVRFGTNSAAFGVVSNSQITAFPPPGSGAVTVRVTSPSGTSNGVTYTYVPAPVLTSLAPGQGPTSGGNPVILTGTGFTGASTVQFGAASAVFTVNSSTQITATAPAGSGSVAVTVTTPGGTSNSLTYTYVTAAAPVVIDLGSHFGPTAGGNSVTILGAGLTGATAVHFGAQAAGFTVVGDNQITATAPAGTGTVVVTVTTPGGTSSTGIGNPYYTYVAQPALTSLAPDTGPATGGTGVTINGTALTYTDKVFFGATLATFAAISDTIVLATAPPGAGSVPVTVHSPGGTSNPLTYTYQ
ncbi:cell shape-determining protein [Streptomyces sp. CNQ-509]|uniref:IPT/TIG domain-containing protein n=1 Tax=Streptomyces sp. CNQ-509 TaxID=444103 RepID=UPI00062DCDE6|nr:IPT/TIG domain-containing protein [Streptomyces sp. CNQ-509]AKH84249.1 cell shape-determining protein [Streptomyces sp. CNQ-509]